MARLFDVLLHVHPGLLNAAPASWLAVSKAFVELLFLSTRRMPLPPPPAVAFRITG